MKKIVLALMLFSMSLAHAVDFNVDFMRKYKEAEAERLLGTKKHEEAREAFEKLAATAGDAVEKANWKARAAVATGLQEGKFEEGMAMAKAVEDRAHSVLAQIELLASKRDYKGLVEAFGDEDIASWPARRVAPRYRQGQEEDARGLALLERGRAYYQTGDGEAAAKDLEQAADLVRNSRVKLDLFSTQAANYSQRLDDAQKAFQANMKTVGLGGGGATYYRGVIGAAGYLRNEGKYDEALEVLDQMNPYDQRGYWLGAGLLAVGRTLTEAGRTDEALDAYNKIVESGDGNSSHRGAARLAIAETLLEQGKTVEAADAYKELVADEESHPNYRKQAEEALEKLENPQQ